MVGSTARLQPITDATVEVLPKPRRQAALAALARSTSRPPVRVVTARRNILSGDPDNDDVIIAMSAKIGWSDNPELVGVVRLRERHAPRLVGVGDVLRRERAFLIDALTIAEPMRGWQPPIRTLLIATAASLVATISHDPAYRTYVACRVGKWDAEAEDAVRLVGGHPLHVPPGIDDTGLCFGDVPSSELHFLDGEAANKAASILLSHLNRDVVPTQNYPLPGRDQTCQAIMSISFPRMFSYLAEELELLARSGVNLGWSMPSIISNDVVFPLRAANAG